ncbi:MAG TPA: hypothetical protein PLL30_12805 [Candidatus Krumholzibacteria bacterium]|nr:hypothetical protein [Candidatus Krumholzibacteria bacterium]HPD72649.1 hypothetical protein [Candidatus Krumholzibacteria bacterium]HRY40419.1 hypothetical protein [Candidatus Krumholzibacteria bacterium]
MSPDRPPRGERWEDLLWQKHHYNDRTALKSGSYLRAYCPHCDASLIRGGMIRLESTTLGGQDGWVELSPYLNVFERRSDIRIPEGEELADLRCWHCHRSLRVEGLACGLGDDRVASVLVGVSSVRVPFYFCLARGCGWHRLDPEDVQRIILDDSQEW